MPTLTLNKCKAWKAVANAHLDQSKAKEGKFNRIFSNDVSGIAAMTVSGCQRSGLRAASFMCLTITSKLFLMVNLRFEARISCCGRDTHHRRQSYRQGGKPEQLDNQVHGRITPFPEKKALPAHGTCFGGLFWRSLALRFPYMTKTRVLQ